MKDFILEYYATVGQLADLFCVNQETVRRWIRSGKLKAIPSGKGSLKRIPISDLIEFVNDRVHELEDDLSKYKKLQEYLNQRRG